MMGGMLETRLAITASMHFALASPNIIFFDMDSPLLGHLIDPITGGIVNNGYTIDIPDTPGIGADVDPAFLESCEKWIFN
jgi:L-alanine-DL-glutamate epimerase-like enolase superfamily enzyme